jgi:beta-lactamase regulating signal transducer with metallopeptidase domain
MDHAINWVWQGCLIAAMTIVVLRLMEHTRAQARHVVCCLALTAVTLLPVLPSGLGHAASSPVQPSGGAAVAPVLAVPAAWWTSTEVVALAAALWFLVAAWRLASNVYAARRARAGCTPFGSSLEGLLRCWTNVKTQGRETRLMVSPDVRAASVLGGGRPIIAVAPALIGRLTPDELDRVVIHEWAHVQRRDDLLSIAHAIVRAVAGWHPAVWVIERRMLIEREIACDETAVRLTGCPKRYAACLTTIASLPAASLTPIEAVGVLSTPALSRRVVRILSRRRLASPALSAGAAAIAVLVLGAFSIAAAGHRVASALGSEPMVETSSSPMGRDQVANPVTNDVAAEATRVAVARPTDPGTGAMEITRRGQTSVPQSHAAQDDAARDRTGPGVPPPDAAATPATHREPTATASELTPPRLVPLAAAMPSLPVIDKPALSELLLTAGAPPTSPWVAVADAGVSVGHGSRQAGVATGQFFTRLGKKIAGSF